MKISHLFSHSLLVFSLLITMSGLLFLTSCVQNDLGNMTNNQISPLIPIDFNVDFEPEPLKEIEKILSHEGYGAKGALNDKNLTINDMLTYAVQDEYLAHGEYVAVIEKFGKQRPYINIVKSEETHLSYLEEVYLSFNMEFPEDTSADHIVVPTDLLEAAKLGVQAEIDNIAMYELFMTFDLPDNVYEVFYVLKSGSENHLKAFQKQVDLLS